VRQVREAAPDYRAGRVRVLGLALQGDKTLLGSVTATVATMPLWKLQTIGGEVRDILYENVGTGREFALRPGMAYCFRKFHGFTHRMAQDSWARFVRGLRQNHQILDETADLANFMFGADRASLAPYRNLLADLQGRRCFYCDSSKGVDQVDRFIPWSWYSIDLGHNFVLACERCNGAKSDMLAAPEHLDRWLCRNGTSGGVLREYFEGAKWRRFPGRRDGCFRGRGIMKGISSVSR